MKPRKSHSSAVGLKIFKKLNKRTFQTLQLEVIQLLWEKMSLKQEKFTTGSFYAPEIPHLITSPEDKLVCKYTEKMLRETQPVTRGTEDALHGQQPQKGLKWWTILNQIGRLCKPR